MFLHLVLLPLLVFVPLHLSVLAVRVANAPELGWPELAPAAVFLAALLVVWGALRLGRYAGSPAVPSAAMALLGTGIALQYRIGTLRTVEAPTPSQLALPIGIATMLAVWLLLRRRRIERLEPLWGVFLGAAVAVTSALARSVNFNPSNIRLPSKRGSTGSMASMASNAHSPSP